MAVIGMPQSKPKPVFQTPDEARLALSLDKLGTVYIRASDVYVVTAHGSGTFGRDIWDGRAPVQVGR